LARKEMKRRKRAKYVLVLAERIEERLVKASRRFFIAK